MPQPAPVPQPSPAHQPQYAPQPTPVPQPRPVPRIGPLAPTPPASAPAADSYLIQHVEPKPAPVAAWPDPGEPDPAAATQPDPYAWNPGTSGSGPMLPAPKLLVWPTPEPRAPRSC